jgi:hypothetical protein
MKEYHRKIIDQLDSLLENNPKKYWSLLDDIAKPCFSESNICSTTESLNHLLDFLFYFHNQFHLLN